MVQGFPINIDEDNDMLVVTVMENTKRQTTYPVWQ